MKCFITIFFSVSLLITSLSVFSKQVATISSPDQNLRLNVNIENGKPSYSVAYKGKDILENSPLGLSTNEGDFLSEMTFVDSSTGETSKAYTQAKIKASFNEYTANSLKCTFSNADEKQISVLFQVSNNDVAFRYELPMWGDTKACIVESEATGYRFPSFTTSFLSHMMRPMQGFARTSPSYESGYEADLTIDRNQSREGYVFPGLFKVGDNGWALLSETGVRSLYCASHLSNYNDGVFKVEYPNPEQNNGFGSTGAQLALPGVTPWRTITVGESLKPIVETTIPWDLVEPLYEPS
ncbi:MAG: glycoside hydrolase family 97 N-terminal domain-containing protein, partial [Prolixibacteraceae bacterium]|nr:glycoside hydrolase family 97 N-terminal domain-containing protein [Prolixibacteraceae bacterium]